jgi:hypothetical protein
MMPQNAQRFAVAIRGAPQAISGVTAASGGGRAPGRVLSIFVAAIAPRPAVIRDSGISQLPKT